MRLDYRAIESAANRRGIACETCSTQLIAEILALDLVLIIVVMQLARVAGAEVRSPLRARGAIGAGARSSLRAGDMVGGAAGALVDWRDRPLRRLSGSGKRR